MRVLTPNSIRVRVESRYSLFQISTKGGTCSSLPRARRIYLLDGISVRAHAHLMSMVNSCPSVLLCLVLGAAPLIPARGVSQTSQSAPPPSSAPQSATVPAGLLALGAALQEHATPELKKWVKGYAKKEFKELPADSNAPAAAVAQRFPAASPEARSAVVFLLFHTGYHEEGETQKRLAGEIHDIDH